MGHSISDMDSFGAAVGIYCAAHVMGKKAYIVLNEVTSSLRPMKECFTEEKGYPEDRLYPGHFFNLPGFTTKIRNLIPFLNHYLVSAPAQGKFD